MLFWDTVWVPLLRGIICVVTVRESTGQYRRNGNAVRGIDPLFQSHGRHTEAVLWFKAYQPFY